MAKRCLDKQQQGDRKRSKLNISVSDHNFPLSQNAGPSHEINPNNWGDENDDEILLLASQACEEDCSNDSNLADYSHFMKPASTSTQIEASTSKGFIFKKPCLSLKGSSSTQLKDKCNIISTPLPGLSKVLKTDEFYKSNKDVFSDKVCNGQDTDLYHQLLQLQEENAKLKTENCKLSEKCVTKEGESSILRTQLKTCQVAVDNARLDKIKAQEKLEVEWNEKLRSCNHQMQDLRIQLDFKNLEIINVKEKCKWLESNKVRLTQVTVASNDLSNSFRHNNNGLKHNDASGHFGKKVKLCSNSVQTEDKLHIVLLNKGCVPETSSLNGILQLIVEPSFKNPSILEYNEKLQKDRNIMLNTLHWLPNSAGTSRVTQQEHVCLSSVLEDVTFIAGGDTVGIETRCWNIFNKIRQSFQGVEEELNIVVKRMTTAFQREMDEKYIDATSTYTIISKEDLLRGRSLYKDEQAIDSRRLTAVLEHLLDYSRSRCMLIDLIENGSNTSDGHLNIPFIDLILRICTLLDTTCCAILYSGLLLSIVRLLRKLVKNNNFYTKINEIIKLVILSRPLPFVSCEVLKVLAQMALVSNVLDVFCPKNKSGNLKTDYDQGVLLYKTNSCTLQVLVKQIECTLKCIERDGYIESANDIARELLAFFTNCGYTNISNSEQNSRCNCQIILMQVLVYSLRICVVMYKNCLPHNVKLKSDLLSVCRTGLKVLYQCSLRDPEFSSQLTHNEGHFIEFCELMEEEDHGKIYGNIITELVSAFKPVAEDTPCSYYKQAWEESFKTFIITD